MVLSPASGSKSLATTQHIAAPLMEGRPVPINEHSVLVKQAARRRDPDRRRKLPTASQQVGNLLLPVISRGERSAEVMARLSLSLPPTSFGGRLPLRQNLVSGSGGEKAAGSPGAAPDMKSCQIGNVTPIRFPAVDACRRSAMSSGHSSSALLLRLPCVVVAACLGSGCACMHEFALNLQRVRLGQGLDHEGP